jgi:hypothetical protein
MKDNAWTNPLLEFVGCRKYRDIIFSDNYQAWRELILYITENDLFLYFNEYTSSNSVLQHRNLYTCTFLQ